MKGNGRMLAVVMGLTMVTTIFVGWIPNNAGAEDPPELISIIATDLKYPTDVALDESRNIYVCDKKTYLIKEYDPNGDILNQWGGYGSGDGQFINGPWGIAVDSSGNVYVADSGNHRIQKFDSGGSLLNTWQENMYWVCHQVMIDSEDNVYVTDSDDCHVEKYDTDGNLIATYGGREYFQALYDVALDSSGNFYCVDYAGYCVKKFSADFTTLLGEWGGRGTGDGEFDHPCGVAVDSNDNVYVTEVEGCRVQMFDSSGDFLAKWGGQGEGEGEFSGCYGIAIDPSDRIYVVDGNGRIQIFGCPNEAPVASISGGDRTLLINEQASFDGSGSLDPDGTISTYEWDWGDSSSGTKETAEHGWSAAGEYTVTLTVTDDGGATDETTITVTVMEPAAVLEDTIDLVVLMDLDAGVENVLVTKLDEAIDKLEQGQSKTAKNNLEAFINKVEAQRGKKISADNADKLIDLAERIIENI